MKYQKYWALLFTILLSISAQAVAASSLQQSKSSGWVGEQTNGYVGFVTPGASNEVKKMVAQVNNKRRTIYTKLAVKQKISLGQVELLAGARNIKKTASGQYVQDSTGNWFKKK